MGKSLETLFGLIVVAGGVYLYLNWDSQSSGGDGSEAHAERSCVDEIQSRYPGSPVSVYRIDKVADGYRVRTSVRLSADNPVKMICLANEFGRVEDVQIEDR